MDVAQLSQNFSTSPSHWTGKEISRWLELLNMKEYHDVFEQNKVDGLVLFDLEDKEIEELLNIKNSIHRKRLRNGINLLKQFKSQSDKVKGKGYPEINNENQPELYGESPNLSTSVFNNQQAKVLSIKSNQLYSSNLQTA